MLRLVYLGLLWWVPIISQSQSLPKTEVIEHLSPSRPYASALFIVFTYHENDSSQLAVKNRLFNQNLALEVVVQDSTDYKVGHVANYITDAINFGRVNEKQVFVVDFTRGYTGTKALLAQIPDQVNKVLAYGSFDTELYQSNAAEIKFLTYPPGQRLPAQEASEYFFHKRKWGSDVSEGQARIRTNKNTMIASRRKGMWFLNAQRGSWFLLSRRDDDNERFQLKGNGATYRVSLGYGLTDAFTIKAGATLSFERPNEDELAQQNANNTPTPGVPFSNQIRDHYFVSPFVGLQYRPKLWPGKIQPYFLATYERVNIEFFNLRVSINGAGQPRNRLSTDRRQLNSLRYGAGLEAQIEKRFYVNFQVDMQTTEPFERSISGVDNFNNLAFQFGLTYKLGKGKKERRK